MRELRNHGGKMGLGPACLLGAVLTASLCSHLRAERPQDAGREISTFGPFLTNDGGFTVTMRYAKRRSAGAGQAADPPVRTLVDVVVADATGRTVYRRDFVDRTTTQGLEPDQDGTAYEVRAESGTAIVIEAGSGQPPANPSGWMIALVPDGKGLRVAGPEIRFHGNLEHFPGPSLGPRQLRAGDFMATREWTGHYSMIRGFRANFRTGSLSPLCVHNCTLPVTVQIHALQDGQAVRLHSEPLGSFASVVLRRDSKVEYLDTFVADLNLYDRESDDPTKRPWLHVRVDGREGWVTSAADLMALGLPYSK
jgi:hypothetical protein